MQSGAADHERGTVTDTTRRHGMGAGAQRRRGRGYGRRLTGILLSALFVVPLSALIFGLVYFAGMVRDYGNATPIQRADAIVVLTGGTARIADAIDLLERGHADRLLITGVHPDNTSRTLASFAPGRDDLFACCVDLGYLALNTVGNAKEARDWAQARGYRSLIVVTSAYHLPRSLTELRREMPQATLIPHAVVVDHLTIDDWWRDPHTARILLSEYGKYLLSIAQLRWRPSTTVDVGITKSRANG